MVSSCNFQSWLHNDGSHIEDDDFIEKFTEKKAKVSRKEMQHNIKELEAQMKKAAKEFDFEKAAMLRDIIFELKSEL